MFLVCFEDSWGVQTLKSDRGLNFEPIWTQRRIQGIQRIRETASGSEPPQHAPGEKMTAVLNKLPQIIIKSLQR